MRHPSLRPAAALLVATLAACAADTEEPAPVPEGLEVEVIRPVVLTEAARIPQHDPAYESAEVLADRVIFTLSGSLETPLEAGNVIVGDAGAEGYLRTVVSAATLSDGRLEVLTDAAVLTDLIADGHFIVRYQPSEAEAAAASMALTDEVAGRRDALESGVVAMIPTGLRGFSCGGGATHSAQIDSKFDLDYGIEMELDIGVDWGWTGPRPDLEKFLLRISGSIEAGIEVQTTEALVASCEIDLLALFGGRTEIPLPSIPIGSILGIPLVITEEIEPTLSLDTDFMVETANTTYSAEGRIGLEVGVQYDDDGGWQPIWEPDAWAGGALAIGERGAASLTSRLAAGLEYQARLNGLAGPNIGLESFVEASAGTSADLCSYDLSVETGLTAYANVELGIDIGPIDVTFVEIELADIDLVRSPAWSITNNTPWCDECTSSVRCMDDLGREICEGSPGVRSCTGGVMICTCSASGLVDCSTCEAP